MNRGRKLWLLEGRGYALLIAAQDEPMARLRARRQHDLLTRAYVPEGVNAFLDPDLTTCRRLDTEEPSGVVATIRA